MYQPHSVFATKKSIEEPIWRYMSFTKFLSLLYSKQLFFSSVSELQKNDPFEGRLAELNQSPEYRRDVMSEVFKHFEPEMAEMLIEQWYFEREKFIAQMAHFTVVNCWHINRYESAAMWKLYLSGGEGVAIRSSFDRLKRCFLETSRTPVTSDGARVPIHIGEVRYIDHRNDIMDDSHTYRLFLYKYKAFEHERELRAMSVFLPLAFGFDSLDLETPNKELPEILKKLKSSKGISFPIDLETLIDEIVLAPNSPQWIAELAQTVISQTGLKLKIRPSELF
ncbi:MAG: hypothetical protein J0M07_14550 [Anaerolineae bacterium]|nr:hypothetical protein [Anaerolineae bacterium]